MRYLAMLSACLLLVACEKVIPDPFFRYWSSNQNQTAIDLTNGKFSGHAGDTETFERTAYDLADGKNCTCEFWIKGDYEYGFYSISGCEGEGPFSVDSICTVGQAGTYRADSMALQLCPNDDPDECVDYR